MQGKMVHRWAFQAISSRPFSASAIAALAASFVVAARDDTAGDAGTSCDAAIASRMSNHPSCASPSWIGRSDKTSAECRICRADSAIHGATVGAKAFDPVKSDYFEVKLVKSSVGRDDCDGTRVHVPLPDRHSTPILPNKIAVLPKIITTEECASIVNDTERILKENSDKKIRGRKTESWAAYSRFSSENQEVMDRILGEHVLEFLDRRMPGVVEKILNGQRGDDSDAGRSTFNTLARTFGKTNAKEVTSFCWDDPVVIKYDAGNCLAPHEDMRDLTIVIPLNPLAEYPLRGGGTMFWLEETTPDLARAEDGVLLKPPAGWGIIFNGEITHSGESVEAGTRFVLMTSIVLDDDDDDDDEHDEEEGE